MVPVSGIPLSPSNSPHNSNNPTRIREAAIPWRERVLLSAACAETSTSVRIWKADRAWIPRNWKNRGSAGINTTRSRHTSEQVSPPPSRCGHHQSACRSKLLHAGCMAPSGHGSHDVRSDMTQLEPGVRDIVKLMLKCQTSPVCRFYRTLVLALPTPHSFVTPLRRYHNPFMPRQITAIQES